jgi:hypothetical protein
MATQRYFTKSQEQNELDFIEYSFETDRVFPVGTPGDAPMGAETRLAAMVVRLEARVRFLEEMLQRQNVEKARKATPMWFRNLAPGTLRWKVWRYFWARSMAKKVVKQWGLK